MKLNELETIWTGNDAEFQRSADRVDARLKRSTTTAEQELREQARAAESLQKQRSAALLRQLREEEHAREAAARKAAQTATKLHRDQIGAVESLLNRLPGGGRITQFKALADDIKLTASAAKEGTGALAALGGASGAALLGIGALAVGAVAVGAGVFSLAQHTAEAGSRFHDLSAATGLSVETISGLELALKQSGTSMEALSRSTFDMQKRLAQAAQGNKELKATFADLGVKDAQAALADTDGTLRVVLKSLGSITDAGTRNALGNRVLGRTYRELATFISDTNGDVEAAIEHAKRLGLVMGEDAVAAADKFGDSMDELAAVVTGAGRTIGNEVIPELTGAIEDLTGATEGSFDAWKELGGFLADSIQLMRILARTARDAAAGMDVAAAAAMETSLAFDEADKRKGSFKVGEGATSEQRASSDRELKRAFREAGLGAPGGRERIGGGGAGGGESAAKRAARAMLESARIDLREAESVFKEENATAKRALDLNLNNFAEYQKRREEAENERFAKQRAAFAAELQAAGSDAVKRKDAQQRETDAVREHNERMAEITVEGQQHAQDVKEKFADAALRLQQERQRLADLELAQQIAQGTTTEAAAVEARYREIAKVAEKQGEVLRLAIVKSLGGEDAAAPIADVINETISNAVNGASADQLQDGFKTIIDKAENKEAAKTALQAVLEFFIQRKQAWQQGTQELTRATADDLSAFQSYAQRLADVAANIRDINLEIQEARLRSLEGDTFNRSASIEARRALGTGREAARFGDRVARLEAERERVKATEQNETKRAEIVAAIDREIEAETRLHQSRLTEIERTAAEERRQMMVEVARDIGSILGAGLRGFSGDWSDAWHSMLQEALSVIKQIGEELLNMSLEALFNNGKASGSTAGGIVGAIVNSIGGALFGNLLGGGLPNPGSAFRGIPGGAGGLLTPSSPASFLPHFAKGGDYMPGWKVVGEHGPELDFSASPGHVFSAADTKRMLGGRVENNYYTVNAPPVQQRSYSQRRAARESAEIITNLIKTRGR